MKPKMLRTATVKKINSFIKSAQTDEEPAAGEEALDDLDENMEDLGDLPEGEEEPLEEEPAEGEEDVTGEVEELEEHVEEIDEKLETVIDGLESQKEVLEDLVGDGEFKEDEFEDFLEEEQEEDEEDISSDEFGLDEEQFAKKESRMTLREKRRARLQNPPRRVAKNPEETTLSEQWENEQDRKDRFSPLQPAPTITKVKEDEVPAMLRVSELALEQSADKKEWLVLDKSEKPRFVIQQGKVAREEFQTPAFAKQVLRDMMKLGLRTTLKKYHAKKYVKAEAPGVPEAAPGKKPNVAPKVAPTDPKADPKTEKTALANYQRRFTRAFRLALSAMNKNLVKPVPLKEAFFEILSDLDVADPAAVIEAAFRRAGAEHFETAIAQAEKYLGMSDEAFVETEAMVGQTEAAAVPKFQAEASKREAEELKLQAAQGSVPFTTSTEMKLSTIEKMQAALPKPKLCGAKHLFGARE